MANDDYKSLLQELPTIAKVVNAFSSNEVQKMAYDLLLQSLIGQVPDQVPPDTGRGKRSRSRKSKSGHKVGAKPRQQTRRAQPSIVQDLNLRPKNGKSLRDFMAEKAPKKQPEQLAVMVYYLKKRAKVDKVTVDHVYTCFKEVNVRVPGRIEQSLRNTSHRKGWISTEDLGDVTLTVTGENFVEHDLPHKGKKE